MLEQFQINLGYFLKNKDNNNNNQLSDYIKIYIIQEKLQQTRISINNKKSRIKSMLKMYGNWIKNIMKSNRKIILLLKNWRKSTRSTEYNCKGY
jgi:hypothetical protein